MDNIAIFNPANFRRVSALAGVRDHIGRHFDNRHDREDNFMGSLRNQWLDFKAMPMLHGVGAIDDPFAADNTTNTDWTANIPKWISTAQTAMNAQTVFDLNVQRAQQGLAPIDPKSLAPTVNVGLDPGTQKMLLIAGVALLAVMMLKKRA